MYIYYTKIGGTAKYALRPVNYRTESFLFSYKFLRGHIMKLNGAEITIKLLEMQGIETIAGIPGGSILPLYDALSKSKKITHILARHEQGGAFIAHGMARSTGKTAVCFATSGPGATNLLTGIADAKMDSVPLIAITGQVPYSLIGTDAFQEIDIYGLTIPITKHNFFVHSVEELFSIIPEAFRIANSDRPGPVLIDIPKNIQTQVIEFDEWPSIEACSAIESAIEEKEVLEIAEVINSAKRPMLYIGGGVINSNACEILYEFAKKNSIPVASTLMGLGAFPCDDPLYLGLVGMHAAQCTNILMSEADLILAFGVRFDDRATGNISRFCPNAKLIHIEIDESEINKLKPAHYSIAGDIYSTLNSLIPYIKTDDRSEWIKQVEACKSEYCLSLPSEEDIFHPINIIKYVASKASDDTIITTDVGQHQMWTAQVYPFKKPRTLITSGGLGTMGFGLPAAIGAALANPKKPVICFSGDGSILMNIQELATLADLNLNVKVILLNNGHLGLVNQQQKLFFNNNRFAVKFTTNPNFELIGKGFNIESYDLEKEENPLEKLSEILSKTGPCIVNIPVDPEELVLPMVPPGGSNDEMVGGENYVK